MTQRNEHQPIELKREEIKEFDQIIDAYVGLSGTEERFTQRSVTLKKGYEKLQDDGNAYTRFKFYLKLVSDFSMKELDVAIAKVELLVAKIDGSHWGAGIADLDSKSITELKEYADTVNMPRPWPRKKQDLIDVIKLHVANQE